MAQLAIKGHKSRGNEVIEILEMLGGKNLYNYCADCDSLCFYIGKETNIIYYDDANTWCEDEEIVLTLEEFLEKFPYKVGDKVVYKIYGIHSKIKTMLWNVEKEQVFYRLESNKLFVATADELQLYKEDAMDKAIKAVFNAKVQCCDIMNDIIKKDMEEIKIEIPAGYEFVGIDDDNQQVVFTKIQPEYPKTYEKCCEVLGKTKAYQSVSGYKTELLEDFQKLLICRDAYWKIGGDWKYDVNKTEEYFYIVNKCGRIVKEHYMNFNHILAFPTAEMRDAFYENFKDLIEGCKELL